MCIKDYAGYDGQRSSVAVDYMVIGGNCIKRGLKKNEIGLKKNEIESYQHNCILVKKNLHKERFYHLTSFHLEEK